MSQLNRNKPTAEQVYGYAAHLRAQGYSSTETQQMIHQNRIDEPSVMAIPADIQQKETEQVNNTALKSLFHGIVWLLAGMALLMIVYAASSSVKAYALPYMAFFIGIIYLVKAQLEKF